MKSKFIVFLLFFVSFQMWSQEMSFDKLEHDFGNIKEEGGNVSHQFKFKNVGAKPLIILAVDVECGCTTPDWTKETIQPGGEGIIKAEYEPYNRPGEFHKGLTVRSTVDTVMLKIIGFVEPRIKENFEVEYPESVGSLFLKNKNLQFGNITTEKVVTKDFTFYNNSSKQVVFDLKKLQLPSHLKINIEPVAVPSKQYGRITVIYDPKTKNDYGYLSDDVKLYTNDDSIPVKEFTIRASIEEYFPPLTPEIIAKAPVAKFNEIEKDLGKVDAGQQASHDFVFTNTGKSDLIIRKVKATCECLKTELSNTVIKPGQTAKIKVVFDSKDRSGTQVKTVWVYCTDPKTPTIPLKVKVLIN